MLGTTCLSASVAASAGHHGSYRLALLTSGSFSKGGAGPHIATGGVCVRAYACVCVWGGRGGERECGRVLGKGRGNSPAREAKLPLLFDGGMPSVRYVMA